MVILTTNGKNSLAPRNAQSRNVQLDQERESQEKSGEEDFFHYSDNEESAPGVASRDEISIEVTRYLLDKDTSLDMLHRFAHIHNIQWCLRKILFRDNTCINDAATNSANVSFVLNNIWCRHISFHCKMIVKF